jgi:hypothetical protein
MVTSMEMAVFWDDGAVGFSEMVVIFYKTTWHIIPEDSHLDNTCFMN